MKPICLKCRLELKPKKIGVYVELMTADGPYHLYACDVWDCPVCGFELLHNFGQPAIAQHFQSDYQATTEKLQPIRYWSTKNEMETFRKAHE